MSKYTFCKLKKQILDHDSAWRRKQHSQQLKQALFSKKEMGMKLEFHIFFSGKNDHTNHLTGQVNMILSYTYHP